MRAGLKVVLVAAVGENGVIGREGQLPWRLRSDLQHFKNVTMNRPMIMGRKTFASIGKALPGRTNIVLTRDAGFAAPGCLRAASWEEAFAMAGADAKARGVDEVMIIGGSDVFTEMMRVADRLEITRVHASPAGDVTFPAIDPQLWRETRREPHPRGPQDDTNFTILTYARAV